MRHALATKNRLEDPENPRVAFQVAEIVELEPHIVVGVFLKINSANRDHRTYLLLRFRARLLNSIVRLFLPICDHMKTHAPHCGQELYYLYITVPYCGFMKHDVGCSVGGNSGEG